MPNEINITVRSKDRSELDKLGDEGKRAGKELGDGIKKGFKEAEQAGDSSVKSMVSNLRDKLGDAGREAGGSLTDSFMSGKASLAGAGAALGGLLIKGITDAVEQGKVGASVAAATGQASEQAGRMGKLAGSLFANSFGESVEDAGRALTAVFQEGLIDPSASDAAITNLTGKILTVSATVEEEAQKVSRSARTMVVNGVADNVAEALDIIQHATEKGINTAGDLLDTVDEYSVQFARVGLSGQEAFGLISQAIQGGARDADVAADAIKEFAIRAQDGSATTARGFETLGLNAEDMGARIAAGGKTAHDALRLTLNALQQMPPGVERSTAAVDLFGTKAEDMGDALFEMDLDDAVREFGDVSGSVDQASQTAADSIPVWETWGKNLNQVLTSIGDGFVNAGAALDSFMDGISGVEGGSSAARAAIKGMGEETDNNADAQGREAESVQHGTGVIQEQIETIDEWIAKKQEAAGVILGVRESERQYQEAIDDTTAALEKNGKTHDNNTEKGRDNNDMLDKLAKSALDHAAAMSKDGKGVAEVNKHMTDARARYIAAARAMGYSAQEATDLANQLKLVPKNIRIDVLYRDAAARANLASFKRAVDSLDGRVINVSTYVRGANIIPGAGGGKMFVQAAGGITPHSAAETGGARNGGTLINEAGPEVVRLPNGSNVATAGATRALAERGLLQLDGIVGPDGTVTEFAASGGARGRGVPAYRRTGQVDISPGKHSERFIANLLREGWRMMDGNPNMLYSPARQRRAGPARHFAHGDLASTGQGGGVLETWDRATPFTGGRVARVEVDSAADTAVGQMINRLIRDQVIRVTVRS